MLPRLIKRKKSSTQKNEIVCCAGSVAPQRHSKESLAGDEIETTAYKWPLLLENTKYARGCFRISERPPPSSWIVRLLHQGTGSQ